MAIKLSLAILALLLLLFQLARQSIEKITVAKINHAQSVTFAGDTGGPKLKLKPVEASYQFVSHLATTAVTVPASVFLFKSTIAIRIQFRQPKRKGRRGRGSINDGSSHKQTACTG